ncbi:ATP-binding cassette domain-containing protein [Spirillospora sp. CA-294931]|uniref:ATP-binding cassette domain-containing protein n=1 Tax=Spirillospora sp. CA-294931 TaxID=3240042 RepID=UPI003D89D22F
MNVVEVRGVRVRFGERVAVRDVSFEVAGGEVYALLGGVGAGKTTVLEVASGLRRPEAGVVKVRGADPCDAPVSVGWRDGGLFPGLTVAEVVDTWRRWTLDPLTRDEALALAGLQPEARFEALSPGERRLLDLTLALIGRSDVLFLDEPTSGLDAASSDLVWAMLRKAGVTTVVATRELDEACRADRIGILEKGALVTACASGFLRAA